MVTGVESRILQRLGEWEHRDGRLPGALELYRELLLIQIEAKSRIAVPGRCLTVGAVRYRLRWGVPLLSMEELALDWNQVKTTFERIAAWARGEPGSGSEETERLTGVARDASLLRQVVSTWYQGRSLRPVAMQHGIDDGLLASVVGATLKPFMLAHSQLLSSQVDQESWRRRYCPVCGARPDFAYLDRERGARWLVCSRCDAEWLFQRLECPCCGTRDQDALAYFADEQERHPYRLYVCEQCHTYLRAIDLRRTQAEVLLPLERVMTLHIAQQAREQGYKPGRIDFAV